MEVFVLVGIQMYDKLVSLFLLKEQEEKEVAKPVSTIFCSL
jgi:hypothetical protein